jgi:hypothetical protein
VAFQLIHRKTTGEGHFGVNVGMAREANDNQVVFVIRPSLRSFDDVMDLELRRAEPPTDAAASATLDHHAVDSFGRDFAHD